MTVRLIFCVLPSFLGCPAPIPGELARLAYLSDASFLLLRPSLNSFSGWVAVAFFKTKQTALRFSHLTAEVFDLPFCAVRNSGVWWCVSVPVSIQAFSNFSSSLPCLFLTF
ncbi:MAG: hypothetical protein ACRC2R_25215 [Xenococcaceae cyanobacterium]